MPSAAVDIGVSIHSGTPAGGAEGSAPAPNRQPGVSDGRSLIPRLQRLFSIAPLPYALVTFSLFTFVTQHPVVVLLLMLGFPALLIAQEAVERRLMPAGTTTMTEQTHSETVQPAASESAQPVRRTLPRGIAAVASAAETGSSAAA